MTHLYNCRHDGDQYRITKFDSDLNVESSYLTTLLECECPAGHHSTCRHRQMLPKFIQREAVGTEWFYDFDRGGWVHMATENDFALPKADEPELTLPKGVQLFTLDNPETLYNAIADAVGEPRIAPQAPPRIDRRGR